MQIPNSRNDGEKRESQDNSVNPSTRVVGRIIRSRQNFLALGRFAGDLEIDRHDQVSELPAFATGMVNGDGSRDFFFCYFGEQEANIEYIRHDFDDKRGDDWTSGIVDLLEDSYFLAIRLGRITNGSFDPLPSRFRIKPNTYLSLAREEDIEIFLKGIGDCSWVYVLDHFTSDFLITLASQVAMELQKMSGFNPRFYCLKVFEGLLSSGSYPRGFIVKLMDDLYRACLLPLPAGYIVESSGNKLLIASARPLDIAETTLLETSDLFTSRTTILQCKSSMGYMTEAKKFIQISADGEIVGIPSGVVPGSPVYPANWNSMKVFFNPVDRNILRIPAGFVTGVTKDEGVYPVYPLLFEPGVSSLNACIAGVTRSGKTNAVMQFLLSFARHDSLVAANHYTFNRIGALVFDKQGEFAAAFREITGSFSELAPFIEIIDPVNNPAGKLRLEDLSLALLMEDSRATNPDVTLQKMIKWATGKKEIAVDSQAGSRKKMTPALLDFFLNKVSYDGLKEFTRETGFTLGNVNAVIRQLRKLEDSSLSSILQLVFEEGEVRELQVADPRRMNLLARVFGAQRNGKMLVIDLSNMPGFSGQSRAVNILRKVVLRNLEQDRQKQRKTLGEKKFREETPLFFIVNEEATAEMYSRSVSEIQAWIDSVTQANKHLLGNIFIFQTLKRIDPLVLSQLAGFSLIFRISQQADRENLMSSAAIMNISDFADIIADLETGCAIASNQLLQSKGVRIMIPSWERFVEELLPGNTHYEPGLAGKES